MVQGGSRHDDRGGRGEGGGATTAVRVRAAAVEGVVAVIVVGVGEAAAEAIGIRGASEVVAAMVKAVGVRVVVAEPVVATATTVGATWLSVGLPEKKRAKVGRAKFKIRRDVLFKTLVVCVWPQVVRRSPKLRHF